MTLKGKKNHYNLKLLRGYGVSINLKDNRICLKGGTDPFTTEQEKEEWFVSQIPYERILISGRGYLSTEAIKLLTDHNINIILTDTYGNLVTAMHKIMSSPTATSYRLAQYDAFRNPEKVAYLQKQLLKSKLESQIQSIAVQLRTFSDRESELNTFLKALSAKQYELRSELDLVREHSQQQDIPRGPFSNTAAPLASVVADCHLAPLQAQQLAELEQLSQEQQIAERLAATKAQRQHTTAEPAASDTAGPRNHEH